LILICPASFYNGSGEAAMGMTDQIAAVERFGWNTHAKHNGSALNLIADISADTDFRRGGPTEL